MDTDRRARRCRECNTPLDVETAEHNRRAGIDFCDACLAIIPRAVREGWIVAHPKLTPTETGIGRAIARRVEQRHRAEKRARRRAIARRRQRIAEQPRVGDVVVDARGDRFTVEAHRDDYLVCWWQVGDAEVSCLVGRWGWPEVVRRARQTQEGSEQ